jgi:hypothetical protein
MVVGVAGECLVVGEPRTGMWFCWIRLKGGLVGV